MKQALVVEDIAQMRSWLSDAIKLVFPAVAVHCVANVEDAIKYIKQTPVDLALVDLGLPDGSGVEIISALSHQHPNAISVVVTIFDDNAHLFPALSAGAQGYLLKDQTQQQFVRRLQGISNGEPPLSPAIARKVLSYFASQIRAADPGLTAREKDVLTLIAKGVALPKVATLLEITRNTAAGYVKDIYRKLNISSRAEAAIEAGRIGLINNN